MQVRLLVVRRAALALECSLHEINQANLGQLDEKSMQRIQFVSVECLKSKCIYFGAKVLALPPCFGGGFPVSARISPGSPFLTLTFHRIMHLICSHIIYSKFLPPWQSGLNTTKSALIYTDLANNRNKKLIDLALIT